MGLLPLGGLSVESPVMLGFRGIGAGKSPAYFCAYPKALENKSGRRRPMEQGMSEAGVVYFIRPKRAKNVKIGYASDLKKRIAALQTSHHSELEVMASTPGTMQDEHRWHRRFADERLRGEWFRLSERLHAAIDRLNGDPRAAHNRALLARARQFKNMTDDDVRDALEASETRLTTNRIGGEHG